MKYLLICIWSLCFGSLLFAADESVSLSGAEFEFDGRANLMSAIGSVRYTHKGFVMTGDRSVYHASKNMVELSGNVTLEKDDIALKCTLLKAYITSDRIVALGDVEILYLDYRGFSDQVHFNIRDKRAIMKEHSYLLRGNDKVSSDRIILDLVRKTVKTEGNTQISVAPDAGEGTP